RLCDKSSSIRFVNPLNARSSIWPIRQRLENTRWRLSSPDLTKASRGGICKLFPDKSNTFVSGATLSGIVMISLSMHSTVCLPPFHLQVHGEGQLPPRPPQGTSTSSATSSRRGLDVGTIALTFNCLRDTRRRH